MEDLSTPGAAFEAIFRNLTAHIHTCTVAEVVSYNNLLNTATVQPCIKRLLKAEQNALQLPVFEDVPVVQTGGNGWIQTHGLAKGDYVVVLFAERSIANWLMMGGIQDPQDTRRFDMSDAIAIPLVTPMPTIATIIPPIDAGAMVIRNTTGTISIACSTSGIDITTTVGTFNMDATTGTVTINGNLEVLAV